jgi:outer membrane protein, heavy metal efflux system
MNKLLLVFIVGTSFSSWSAPLTLEELHRSVVERHPALEAARRDTQAAQGEVRASEGAFDIQWKSRATVAPVGYYQNERLESFLEQPTQIWGAGLFAGYRLGTGNFAIYDGKNETNPAGELRAGLSVPIWRDGPTDRRRINIKKSKLGVEVATTHVTQQQIELIRNATHRYWDWAAAGRKRNVFAALLRAAEERDQGLAERVRQGDLPNFERRDNERAIFQRRGQLVTADRALQQATIDLSLFYRDADGKPILASPDRLISEIPHPSPGEVSEEGVESAILRRPDFARFKPLKAQNLLEQDLAANQSAPRIDVQLQAVQNLRDGQAARNGTQVEAGVLLEIPLQANVANGREDSARATAQRLELQESFLRDRIAAEVQDARSALTAASQRWELTRKEAALAVELEKGERERFGHGDSHLLFVNLREQATADAEIRELDALADYRKSLASLKAALASD